MCKRERGGESVSVRERVKEREGERSEGESVCVY